MFILTGEVIAKEKPEWRSWANGDRVIGSIGYYRPKLSTQAAISDVNGFLGAKISFEDTLGLSENKGTAIAFVKWRISQRNTLSFNYFKLDRNATQDSTIQVGIINPAPPPDFLEQEITLPLSAQFNIESLDLTYAFSVISNEKHDLALGIGLALQDLDFGFKASDSCDRPICDTFEPRSVKSTAPLPTFKLVYTYAFNEKWLLDLNLGYFALDFELDDKENLDGQVLNLSGGVRWKIWQNVGLSLGYKFFDVDLDYEKRDLVAAADYDYRGFVFGVDGYY